MAGSSPPQRHGSDLKQRQRRPAAIAPVRHAYSIREACDALGISRPTYYAMVDRGALRVVRSGGRVFVPVAELERLLAGDVSA